MHTPDIWLCFSGGNALGAYHAGVYEVLYQNGVEVGRIAGASIGAVTGAVIAGNRPEKRVPQLRRFWDLAAETELPFFHPLAVITGRADRRRSVLRAFLAGRPGLFRPSFPGVWSVLSPGASDRSLLNSEPLRHTLTELIDFHRISDGVIPVIITAVDIETGEEVVFDSRGGELSVDHIMASTAFPIAFPPVPVGGRTFVDPGIVANLPLQALFSGQLQEDVLCICLDLFAQQDKVPTSMEETVRRTTDILFGAQSRHAMRRLKTAVNSSEGASITIIHLDYGNRFDDIGLKTFDYSRKSINERWNVGCRDGRRLVDAIGRMPPRRHRLDIWRLSEAGLLEYWDL
nr:patatin-like phospholipase family protein [Rhizobium bangladeshense]